MIKHKDARGNYPWSPPTNPNPNISESKEQAAHENPMKIARKRHKNHTSYKRKIDTTMKASIHSEVRFFTNGWKIQTYGARKWEAVRKDSLPGNLRVNIYESLRARQKTTLPLALQLWYIPLIIARPHRRRRPRPPNASLAISPRVHCHRSFSARPDPVSTRRASDLGFVAQPSNPMVLWWTAANPACRLRSWATT
jgi:hypothetical protein